MPITVLRQLALGMLAMKPLRPWLERPIDRLTRLLERGIVFLRFAKGQLPSAEKEALLARAARIATAAGYFDDLGRDVARLKYQPTISVLVPVYKVDPGYFREALRSVTQQVYPHWELCLVDDASGDPRITAVIAEFQAAWPGRIKASINPRNVHISATSNNCLALATGDYVALLDHDDRLYPHALAEMVRYINLCDRPDVLYSDECTVNNDGDRIKPVFFKPDWSPFMHLTMNYTTHLSVYLRDILIQVGGFRVGFEGSQDHDLMLRVVEATKKPVVHVPMCLYQWRAHEQSTAAVVSAKPYAAIAGVKAVSEHLERRGRPAEVTYTPETFLYRVRFKLPAQKPRVSVVIQTPPEARHLRRCLDALVTKTTWPNWDVVIVQSDQDGPEIVAHIAKLQRELGDRVKVVGVQPTASRGERRNAGVQAAAGEYVALLDGDLEVLTPEWLEELVGICQFPEVGVVGCKLLDTNRFVRHGGMVLTPERTAEPISVQAPDPDVLYWNTLNTMHETAALSGACLILRRDRYLEVGGFDGTFLSRAYDDTEFCLSIRAKGWSVLYNGHAAMMQHATNRRPEIDYFERLLLLKRRGQALALDPYMNPNFVPGPTFREDPRRQGLDLNGRDFRLFLAAEPPTWRTLSTRLVD